MLSPEQLRFEIALMGPKAGLAFTMQTLAMFGGNITKMAASAREPLDVPIHVQSEAEIAANNAKALEEWNAPEPESNHEKAVNYILANDGARSGYIRIALSLSIGQWKHVLTCLKNDPRVYPKGAKVGMRWYKRNET